jgi:DNA repair protein RecO (recombination protein O)
VRARTAEAFVLRTGSLGEADVLVTLFTREYGKVRGVARAARRSRKRFGGALEPGTRVRADFVEKEGRDLAQIRDLEVLRSYFDMQRDPAVAAACAFLCEVTDQFAREQEIDELFFRLLGSVLDGLQQGVDPSLAARYFELWTCRIQGLLPDLRNCAACERPLDHGARYEPRHGELRCRSCGGQPREGVAVGPPALELARRMLAQPLGEVAAGEAAAAKGLGQLVAAILMQFVERPFISRRILEEMTR